MMPSTASSAQRRVAICVVDNKDNPIAGADIWFSINGTPVGGVRNSAGRAALDVADSSAVVDISATVGQFTQTAQLLSEQFTHTFRFSHTSPYKYVGTPEACCPDGKTGQPCVDCDLGGVKVRICAV